MPRTRLGKRSKQRRALIIGIGGSSQAKLSSPHRDAKAWRDLIVEKYGFVEDEIVLMLDDAGTPEYLQPTRENVISQIKRFVNGARSGDKFMFYYSGHGSQVATDTEPDGFDEALWISDKVQPILDDELRLHLVERLPRGSCITAVFDACTSGTLLDLEHYECNKVFHDFLTQNPGKPCKSHSGCSSKRPSRTSTRRASTKPQPTGPTDMGEDVADSSVPMIICKEPETMPPEHEPNRERGSPGPQLRIHQYQPMSRDIMFEVATTVDNLAVPGSPKPDYRLDSIAARVPRRHCSDTHPLRQRQKAKRKRASDSATGTQPPPKRSLTFHSFSDTVGTLAKDKVLQLVDSIPGRNLYDQYLRRCSTLEPEVKPVLCDGKCQERAGKERAKAHVISLTACSDGEKTWESKKFMTMTQVCDEPKCSIFKLMKKATEDVFQTTRRHRELIKKYKAQGKDIGDLDDKDSIPQIGSANPLHPNECFNLMLSPPGSPRPNRMQSIEDAMVIDYVSSS
ncbi:caspase domain-containing protein [Epithele typhae]|uniref:caspase domain-containing protein n=1 Tax=Epithele typhae TaxID=378194 RepID=UPI0020084A7B|nr:caspase domain-containing protein [Epithele typhae]KAH9923421.1 caspase domain-containing protein [Epithele typhae]